MKNLEFVCEERDAATCVYKLSGTLHGTTESYAFQDDARERMSAGVRKFVVDLGSVNHVDSSGIGIFATIIASAQTSQAKICLVALSARIRQAMELVKLLHFVSTAESVEAGLATLNRE